MDPVVISAVFDDTLSAQAAITELREIGIPAENISVISRNDDTGAATGVVDGVSVDRENLGTEGITFTASEELPNDEDLSTTTAQMTGTPRPNLNPERDMVRRNDASSNADVDIYTDFPDKPGGVNPSSPAANTIQSATDQRAVTQGEERTSSAVVGAGLGGIAGLLAGIAALAVPGAGPILAAGPLAAALGGMLAGGAVGGIIGALATEGVPEEYAREYAASIEQGHTLISVRTDAIARDAVERVLVAHGGSEVH
jgi:hypothetical protein